MPAAYYSFGGWKASLSGDTHMYGPEGIGFYPRGKVVTSRWPEPAGTEGRIVPVRLDITSAADVGRAADACRARATPAGSGRQERAVFGQCALDPPDVHLLHAGTAKGRERGGRPRGLAE